MEGEMPGSTSPEPAPTRVSGVSVDPGHLSGSENILVPGAAPSAGCVSRGPSSSVPLPESPCVGLLQLAGHPSGTSHKHETSDFVILHMS